MRPFELGSVEGRWGLGKPRGGADPAEIPRSGITGRRRRAWEGRDGAPPLLLGLARRCVGLCALLVALAGLALGASCTRSNDARVVLTVFAASSLTEAFEALERDFERANPGIDVQPSFAGSQVLRVQLEQGAPADVFASANEAHVRALEEAGVVVQPQVFAGNELVVVVPRGEAGAIASFEDLPRATRLVIGSPNVPAGAYARTVLERAAARWGRAWADRVRAHVVSEEANVRLVRAKVELGEADAAFVYRTDAIASDRVDIVPIPEDLGVPARYPIARVARAAHPSEAERFIAFVRSEAGQRVLGEHGFLPGAP